MVYNVVLKLMPPIHSQSFNTQYTCMHIMGAVLSLYPGLSTPGVVSQQSNPGSEGLGTRLGCLTCRLEQYLVLEQNAVEKFDDIFHSQQSKQLLEGVVAEWELHLGGMAP